MLPKRSFHEIAMRFEHASQLGNHAETCRMPNATSGGLLNARKEALRARLGIYLILCILDQRQK